MESYKPHPLRGRLYRKKGWRKPEGSRGCARPSRYGNPFIVGDRHPLLHEEKISRGDAVSLFRFGMKYPFVPWITAAQYYRLEWMREHVAELRGLQLLCFCELDQPCHADVLAELANR